MTAADRPPVTDNARAEAERRWGDRRTSDRLPSDWLDEGMASGFVLGAQWAAGRAETTTACTCDAAPAEIGGASHRPGCGEAEMTTANAEDAYRVAYDTMRHHPGIWYDSLRAAVEALATAGLLRGGTDE